MRQPLSGIDGHHIEPLRLRKAEHKVCALHRRACRALHEIVDCRGGDHPASVLGEHEARQHAVAAEDEARVGNAEVRGLRWREGDEGLAVPRGAVELPYLRLAHLAVQRDVREALDAKGYTVESAETEKIPSNYVSLTEEHSEKMGRLLEYLEDNDDVTEVWHNWDEEE